MKIGRAAPTLKKTKRSDRRRSRGGGKRESERAARAAMSREANVLEAGATEEPGCRPQVTMVLDGWQGGAKP